MIDPVVFLLHKPDVCYSFCYRKPLSPGQLAIHFFASTELYILKTMRRNFWFVDSALVFFVVNNTFKLRFLSCCAMSCAGGRWWEQIVWPDDCPLDRTRVVLASKDQLVTDALLPLAK